MIAERPSGSLPARARRAARERLTLSTRGAWGQVAVAATLITLLPALILTWFRLSETSGPPPSWASAAAAVLCLFLIFLGYALLLKYPASITRLRRYLQNIALDRLPDHVELCHDEDDINAIRQYLEQIVVQAEERIRLLEDKHTADLAAERHRIMTESIGALCHHVGQPAAALGITLHLMQQAAPPPALTALVADGQKAFEEMRTILDRLRDITHYRTEPYLASDPAGPSIVSLPPVARAAPLAGSS
jgi:signal transduction histidine kinase